MSFSRVTFVVVACILSSFSLRGQQQPPLPDICPSAQPAPDYVITAASGSPVPIGSTFKFTLKNDTNLLVRLQDINPFAFKCTVTTSATDIKETSPAAFLGLIGGVAANPSGATTPAASTPPPAPEKAPGAVAAGAKKKAVPATPSCSEQYEPTHRSVLYLLMLRDLVNVALRTTRDNEERQVNEFNDRLHGLVELRSSSACSTIVPRAQALMSQPLFVIASVPVPAPPVGLLVGSPAGTVPLDEAIDLVAVQAPTLAQHLTDSLDDACKKSFKAFTDQDSAVLVALGQSIGTTSSVVDKWRNQVKALNTVRTSIVNAQTGIANVLANRQNFALDTSIHGNQQVVSYTASCSPVPLQTIAAPDSSGSSGTAGAPPSPAPAATPQPSVWTHDFKFGVGPRFVIAGGVVISPLQQITFSTTANPSASGTGSTAPANIITKQQDSSTRILPIAMLHGRLWDQIDPSDLEKILPNYFSVGVTAKSTDNNGTSIEYLFGPSWGFVNRQVFLTVGGYAGHQQRLANSLKVGDATALSAANLPLTQTTIWKAGFAITWAPAGK